MHLIRQYRSLIVPVVSAFLAILWFIFDRHFEPVIVFLTATATSIVIYNQIKNDWVQRTSNYVYTLEIRNPIEKEIDSCVKAILDSELAIIKWKLYHHDGEFKALMMESSEKLDAKKLSKLTWEYKCKPYSVSLGNDVLWETEEM